MTDVVTEPPVRQPPRRRLPDFGGRSEGVASRLLIAPGQLLMTFIVAFPAGLAIYIGFTEWTPTSGDNVWGAYHYWHWFSGYWEALTSGSFWHAMWLTAWFTGVAVGAEFVIGFALALLFLKEFRGRGVLTLFFLLPMLKPIILIALIIRAIEVFKVFDAPYLLTQGGPGDASTTISVYLYRAVIIDTRWGFASAAAIVVLLIVSFAGMFAVRPIEQAQDETFEELVGAETADASQSLEDAIAAEARV